MLRDIPRGLYILGFGGHARSVADIALNIGIKSLVFIDPNPVHEDILAKFELLRSLPDRIEEGWEIFPAVGDNGARQTLCANLVDNLATLVSPDASIGLQAEIGPGTFIGHHAHVGPFARVGKGAIINTGAVIEHDCLVGDFSHVSVNATLAGRCRIGSNVMVGAGATVIDRISISDNVIVGAGATVVDDIGWSGTYVGTPARPLP